MLGRLFDFVSGFMDRLRDRLGRPVAGTGDCGRDDTGATWSCSLIVYQLAQDSSAASVAETALGLFDHPRKPSIRFLNIRDWCKDRPLHVMPDRSLVTQIAADLGFGPEVGGSMFVLLNRHGDVMLRSKSCPSPDVLASLDVRSRPQKDRSGLRFRRAASS